MKTFVLFAFAVLAGASARAGTTNWVNTGADSSWSDSKNWSSDTAVISTQPTDSVIGVDTGTLTNIVTALTFASGLTGDLEITNAGVEQLTITSSLTGSSNYAVNFSLFVNLTGTTITGFANDLNFDSGLSLSGTVTANSAAIITLGSTSNTVVNIQSSASHGSLIGAGTLAFNNTDLVLNLSGALTAGTSMQLFSANSLSGSLDSVTLAGLYSGSLTYGNGLWTGTSGGLTWNFNAGTGMLYVVPEPSSGALFMTAALFLRRRRY